MNRKSIFSAMLCALALFTMTVKVSAQSVKNIPTAIAQFMIAVEEDMYIPMDISAQTMMAIAMQKPQAEADALMYNTYEMIRKMVSDTGKLEILPSDALKGSVTLSRMGYPIGNLKKAAKSGKYEQYATLLLNVAQRYTSTRTRTYENNQETGIASSGTDETAKAFPEILVTLKIAGKDGKVIEKYVGAYRHDEKITISQQSLQVDGWSMVINQKGDVIPYYYYLELAVKDLISKLP